MLCWVVWTSTLSKPINCFLCNYVVINDMGSHFFNVSYKQPHKMHVGADKPQFAARGNTSPNTMCQYGWLADSCQASGPVRSSAAGTDACPSAWVDTLTPTPLVQEDEMCCGVLAKFPEMSTWRDKPMLAPWPSQGWQCGALPRIRWEAGSRPQ